MSTTEPTTIHQDFIAALGSMSEVPRGKTAKVDIKGGGSYSYNYADLGDVMSYVRPILLAHNLVVTQSITGELGTVRVETIFRHVSGEKIAAGPLTMEAKGTPQTIGSAITYARRYALLAALGLATEDDDGQIVAQAARQRSSSGSQDRSGGAQPVSPPQRATGRETGYRTPQEAAIVDARSKLGALDFRAFNAALKEHFGSSLSGLDPDRHQEAAEWASDWLAAHVSVSEAQ